MRKYFLGLLGLQSIGLSKITYLTLGFDGGALGGDFGSESTSALISSFLIGFVSGTSSFFISCLCFFFFFSFCQRL